VRELLQRAETWPLASVFLMWVVFGAVPVCFGGDDDRIFKQ
jgi:hypothetical protein